MPLTHHLDKRAGTLIKAAAGADPEQLLSTDELARWIGCSRQWCESARHFGHGPTFLRLGPRRIRYRRRDVCEWLKGRELTSTREQR